MHAIQLRTVYRFEFKESIADVSVALWRLLQSMAQLKTFEPSTDAFSFCLWRPLAAKGGVEKFLVDCIQHSIRKLLEMDEKCQQITGRK